MYLKVVRNLNIGTVFVSLYILRLMKESCNEKKNRIRGFVVEIKCFKKNGD